MYYEYNTLITCPPPSPSPTPSVMHPYIMPPPLLSPLQPISHLSQFFLLFKKNIFAWFFSCSSILDSSLILLSPSFHSLFPHVNPSYPSFFLFFLLPYLFPLSLVFLMSIPFYSLYLFHLLFLPSISLSSFSSIRHCLNFQFFFLLHSFFSNL